MIAVTLLDVLEDHSSADIWHPGFRFIKQQILLKVCVYHGRQCRRVFDSGACFAARLYGSSMYFKTFLQSITVYAQILCHTIGDPLCENPAKVIFL